MRTIEIAGAFKKDFKRIKTQPRHSKEIDKLVTDVLKLLTEDKPLPEKYKDHPLTGNWSDYRDCHLKPDLVLIYRQVGTDVLRLARLGSHSEIFK